MSELSDAPSVTDRRVCYGPCIRLDCLTNVAVARAEVCGRTLNPCFMTPFRAKGATVRRGERVHDWLPAVRRHFFVVLRHPAAGAVADARDVGHSVVPLRL